MGDRPYIESILRAIPAEAIGAANREFVELHC